MTTLKLKAIYQMCFFPMDRKKEGGLYERAVLCRSRKTWVLRTALYIIVSHTIRWLIGVDANKVKPLPQLPDEVSWVDVDMIPVGSKMLKVLQEDNSKTTLSNRSNSSINWDIRFYGNYAVINLNGVNHSTTVSMLNGRTVSSIQTTVEGNQTSIALLS